jgi:hypothetical protein
MIRWEGKFPQKIYQAANADFDKAFSNFFKRKDLSFSSFKLAWIEETLSDIHQCSPDRADKKLFLQLIFQVIIGRLNNIPDQFKIKNYDDPPSSRLSIRAGDAISNSDDIGNNVQTTNDTTDGNSNFNNIDNNSNNSVNSRDNVTVTNNVTNMSAISTTTSTINTTITSSSSVNMFIDIYIFTYMCVCVYIFLYIHIFIYMYI